MAKKSSSKKPAKPSRKGRPIAHTPARLAADAARRAQRQQATNITAAANTTALPTQQNSNVETNNNEEEDGEDDSSAQLQAFSLTSSVGDFATPSPSISHGVQNVTDSITHLAASPRISGQTAAYDVASVTRSTQSPAAPSAATSVKIWTDQIEPQAAETIAQPATKNMASKRPTTPENQAPKVPDGSSGLSSIPSSIGSTPKGLVEREAVRALHNESPTKNLSHKLSLTTLQRMKKEHERRKASFPTIQPSVERSSLSRPGDDTEDDDTIIAPDQQGNGSGSESDSSFIAPARFVWVDGILKIQEPPHVPRDRQNRPGERFGRPPTDPGRITPLSPDAYEWKSKSPEPKTEAELKQEKKFYRELNGHLHIRSEQELAHERSIWPSFNPDKVTMYGADAQTQHTPAYGLDPSRKDKGHNKPQPRGGRGGGRGGRGRAGGRGRNDESPEPPLPKKPMSQEDMDMIKKCKARQAELRKWFNAVVPSQVAALDHLAALDLAKLAKKPKAHEKVPEYDEVVADLNRKKQEAQDLSKRRFEIEVEAENRRFEAEKAAIENRFKTTVSDLQDEYTRGAQGDLMIFQNAVAAANDDTRTQDGSEAGGFPQYHELPEPDQNIRGYTSTRFTDERPFKHHLRSYNDQATREVIEDEIINAFMKKSAEIRSTQPPEKTAALDSLAAECCRRLDEEEKQKEALRSAPQPGGYLIPRPMAAEDSQDFALSRLADAAEFMAHRYPTKQYIYMPLEGNDRFPEEQLDFTPLPGRNVDVPPPPQPQQIAQSGPRLTRKLAVPRPPSLQTNTRRSLRNLQPSSPLGQLQSQPTTPVSQFPVQGHTFSMSSRSGAVPTPTPLLAPTLAATVPPTLAPAPAKPTATPKSGQSEPLSMSRPQVRPGSIDARTSYVGPISHSVFPPSQNESGAQGSSNLPPLQPRQYTIPKLPPWPPGYVPPPYVPYQPQQFNSSYQSGPTPSPYLRHNASNTLPPPPPGGVPTFASGQTLPPLPAWPQNYSFMPPQQGPTAPTQSPRHNRTQSNSSVTTTSGPGTLNTPAPSPYQQHTFRPVFQNLPPPPPPPTNRSPASGTAGTSKPRARRGGKAPVTFVNQTLATRKAAAEQLAKEEAAAAAEKKERGDKDKKEKKDDKDEGAAGRKLAPKP